LAARFLVRPFNALSSFLSPNREESSAPAEESNAERGHASRHRRVIFAIDFKSSGGGFEIGVSNSVASF
jgi:hypothetical protein